MNWVDKTLTFISFFVLYILHGILFDEIQKRKYLRCKRVKPHCENWLCKKFETCELSDEVIKRRGFEIRNEGGDSVE